MLFPHRPDLVEACLECIDDHWVEVFAGLSLDNLSGRFDISYTKDGLMIRQFQWEGGPGQLVAVTGSLPVNLFETPLLRPGPLSVDAQLSIPDLTAFDFFYPVDI